MDSQIRGNAATRNRPPESSSPRPELLWKVLTAGRCTLLKTPCGAGPVSIREAARRVQRDVKAVHGDVSARLDAGILDHHDGGGIVFSV